jgi:ACS family sodium-dependent inorganic phosphate cotransporter
MDPARAVVAAAPASGWRRRYTLIGLCFLATFVCYLDRTNISVAIIPMSAQFGWDPERQGTVLSAFFVGYLMTQILGGRLADRFGGKLVLACGVVLWSLFTLATPLAAGLGFSALLLARVGLGIGEGVSFPSVYSLVGRWFPPVERARAISLNASGIPLGAVVALLVTPIVVERLGWPWVFYLCGGLGLLWWLPWQWKVKATPADDPALSAVELAEIRPGDDGRRTPSPPWRELLTKPAVWAVIVAHFANNWSLYVLLSWLPTFVNKGLGVPFASVGLFTIIPNIAAFFFINIAGNVSDRMIRKGVDPTRVRKLLQTLSFAGIASALFIVGHLTSPVLAIAVMTIGNCFGAFASGGFSVNPVDIAPRHAGTIMGLSNTFATIPGIVGVYVSGLILASTHSWALVFSAGGVVTLIGMVFYLIFGSSKRLFD